MMGQSAAQRASVAFMTLNKNAPTRRTSGAKSVTSCHDNLEGSGRRSPSSLWLVRSSFKCACPLRRMSPDFWATHSPVILVNDAARNLHHPGFVVRTLCNRRSGSCGHPRARVGRLNEGRDRSRRRPRMRPVRVGDRSKWKISPSYHRVRMRSSSRGRRISTRIGKAYRPSGKRNNRNRGRDASRHVAPLRFG